MNEKKLMDLFLEEPNMPLTAAYLGKIGAHRSTVFRLLKKMQKDGLIEELAGQFQLKKTSKAYITWDISRPPSEKTRVKFSRELLENYIPNETTFLKKEQLANLESVSLNTVRLDGNQSDKVYERVLSSLMIDLTHASSNLENVKISWLDTKTLLEFGERPDGLTDAELKVVLNHKAAIVFLNENRLDLNLSKRDILDVHALLTNGLMGDPSAVGNLRRVVVSFDDSAYLPPDNPHELKEIFELFCEKASKIQNPYEQAFFAMAMIPYMQPFQDGNKRTSRLAMNIPLIKKGLAPFSFSEIKKKDYMFGLLALYEKGETRFLAEAFEESYVKSSKRYGEIVHHVNSGGILNTLSAVQPTNKTKP